MTDLKTDAIWENRKTKDRIILGGFFMRDGDVYMEVFDVKRGEMVDKPISVIEEKYDFVSNNDQLN